ncbi:MAG: peptidase S41 [Bacteroidaceae bacterium]|nr:peptidase S41 [Bacteroidaceae bacterium]
MVLPYLDENRTVKIPLKGYSMRPFLENDRDTAVLTKPHKPITGEPVLALLEDNKWVLHRIVAIDGDSITLLGDGNLTPEHCTEKDIKASVLGFCRKGRTEMDAIDGWKWKAYSTLWTALLPIRRYILWIYRFFS